MALSAFSYATVVAASGNYCTLLAAFPNATSITPGQNGGQMFDVVTYFVAGGTATGNITFQELMPDGVTWVTLTAPASLPLAATALNGSITGPFLGIRVAVGSLAVSTIAQILLKARVTL